MCTLRRTAEENKNKSKLSQNKATDEAAPRQDIEKTTRESTSYSVIQSKRGSFSKFPYTMTGEYILTGSGPWLIPMVLLGRMAKHDSRNAIEASLRANSLSQSPSFHLSLPIAIITGDYRQILYPVKNHFG